MILNEGVRVRMGADNADLLRAFSNSSAAAKVMQTAIVGALSAIATQSVRMAAQLDRDLRLVQTLGGEAAGNVGLLRKEIQSLGREFGRDFNTLARANYQAVSAGFKDIAKSMEVTRAGTKLAISGNADLVQSTEAVAKWMKAFADESLDAEKAAAQLWGTTRDGLVTVEQLGRFLADLPSTMAQSGIKSHELVAALSTLTGVTGNAGRAVDQLRSLIIKMEIEGFSGSLLERIERFNDKGIGELTQILKDQTAATGAQTLAANIGTLAQNIDSAQVVTEDFATAVDTMNNGPLAEWDQAIAGLKSDLTDLGTNVLPLVTGALHLFNQAMEGRRTGQAQMEADIDAFMRRRAGGTRGTGGSFDIPYPTDIPVTLPGMSPELSNLGDIGIALDPFADPVRARQELLMHARRGFGNAAVPQAGATTNLTMAGMFGFQDPSEIIPQDFITSLGQMGDEFDSLGQSSAFAGAAAGILSASVGGLLASAFVTADDAATRFVQGLLAQFAQLGINRLVSSVFGLPVPGFASGGYTGATGGMVHAGEYVFNADAVSNLGLGRLERQHAIGQAGGNSATVNLTINGSADAQEVGRVTKHAVLTAMKDAESSGAARLYRSGGRRYR